MDSASPSLPRNTTVRALRNYAGFILLTMMQDNSTRGLDNR